jgi:hypothetical protein
MIDVIICSPFYGRVGDLPLQKPLLLNMMMGDPAGLPYSNKKAPSFEKRRGLKFIPTLISQKILLFCKNWHLSTR